MMQAGHELFITCLPATFLKYDNKIYLTNNSFIIRHRRNADCWEKTMTNNEILMLDALKRGRDLYGVVAVKAEFEAEGTRPDELLRLLELAQRADLSV